MTYTPTQWDTVADKEKFERQFKKFVEGGFQWKHFPKWFYKQLSMTFGHIAHNDQHGFYEEFFKTPEDRRRFIRQTLEYFPVGDPAWTYVDVERILQQWWKTKMEEYDGRP